MKINGPGKTGKTQKGNKSGDAKKTGDSRFGSMISESGGTSGSQGSTGAAGIGSMAALDALISLQESSDSTSEEAKGRARKRANEMLDQMEHIRMGLLMGGVPVSALRQLADSVAARKDEVTDPA